MGPMNPVVLLVLRKVDGIEMIFYEKNYVTISVKTPVHLYGKKWNEDGVTVEKKAKGYVLTVKMKRATSEEAWRLKCDLTILAKEEGFGTDEWVFNDLTGYLQRWPDGKKAGVYIMKLVYLGLAMYEPFWDSPISNPAQRKKCLAAEQTILKWVDSRPVEQITSNPLEQKVLSKERQIISDAITQMLEQDTNNFSGGKNAD